jgi:hypothetical protein
MALDLRGALPPHSLKPRRYRRHFMRHTLLAWRDANLEKAREWERKRTRKRAANLEKAQ